MSAHQPFVSLPQEATMVFALVFPLPWFQMKFQPSVFLLPPVLKEFLRNRIGEAECNKVRCLRLLAMRQVTPSVDDLAIRIESAERKSASWKLWRRNRLEACVTVALGCCMRLRA